VARTRETRHTDGVVFNLGAGGVAVMLLLALVLFGPSKLTDLRAPALVRPSRTNRQAGARRPAPWSRFEWFIVAAVFILGSLVLALAATHR
jgi:hypothetical protein